MNDAVADAATDTGVGMDADAIETGQPDRPVDAGTPDVPTPLSDNRDRLLDTMATGDRCQTWAALTEVERGVFLTVTDLFGRRSWMTVVSGGEARAGPDLAVALDHVTKIWSIRGEETGCVRCCGGGEFHRIYVSADDALIMALRNSSDQQLPQWEDSRDLAGPHTPFTQSSETLIRLPTGQAHFFATDADSVELDRPGVMGVSDPHLLEVDIDYNIIHESNPECGYIGGSGRELYEAKWSPEGVGGSPEFDYVPSGC